MNKPLLPARTVHLAQVARAAGVHVSVASRALNPQPDCHARVAAATRKKIQRLAQKLGYQPNRAAAFLKRRQIPAIGAFLPAFAPTLFKGLVVGIAETANAQGFPVQFHFELSSQRYQQFLDNLPDYTHCGLITSPYNANLESTNRLLRRFQSARGSLVAVHYHINLQGVCTVGIDDCEGGRMAARHLLARGCRYFIGYNCKKNFVPDWRGYRTQGFCEVLRQEKQTPLLYPAEPAAIAAITEICRKSDALVGIFCTSDRDAVILIGALQKTGLAVGKDVLVMGYDDLYLTADLAPSLTTLHQPMQEIGALAAEKAINMIYGRKEESVLIPPRLIVRESA